MIFFKRKRRRKRKRKKNTNEKNLSVVAQCKVLEIHHQAHVEKRFVLQVPDGKIEMHHQAHGKNPAVIAQRAVHRLTWRPWNHPHE
jgi:hypothetical protein